MKGTISKQRGPYSFLVQIESGQSWCKHVDQLTIYNVRDQKWISPTEIKIKELHFPGANDNLRTIYLICRVDLGAYIYICLQKNTYLCA